MKKSIKYSLWFVFAACVVLFCFVRTSCLFSLAYGDYGTNDVSHGMLVGKYWLEGSVPYRDLFVMGGPLYLALQSLGWLFGGRTGIMILQVLNLGVCFIFVKKTAELFGKKSMAVVIALGSMIPLVAFGCGGNSQEEWILSLLAGMIYFTSKYLCEEKISAKIAFLVGLFGGMIPWIEYEGMGLALALIIFHACVMVRQKQWKPLASMIAGWILPLVIVLLYFGVQGCLEDLWNGAFFYPVQIQFAKGFMDKNTLVHKAVKCFLCVPLLVAGLYRWIRRDKKIGWFAMGIGLVNLMVLMCSDNSWKSFLLTIPTIALGLALVDLEKIWTQLLWLVMAVGVCVICVIPAKDYVAYVREGVQKGATQFMEKYQTYLEENPEALVVMVDVDSSYLLLTDEKPVLKYFCKQTTLADYDENVRRMLDTYTATSENADLLITQEKRWGDYSSEEYMLTEVFIKFRGDICIYVPYVEAEEN